MSCTASSESAPETMSVHRSGRFLFARFNQPQRTASWAIVGGGLHRARTVAWHQVHESELRPPVDARLLLRERLQAMGAAEAVGLLTSRDLGTYTDVRKAYGAATARCLATVGMGNALRAGDLPGPSGRIGTINVLCHLGVRLSDEALLEAMALASEAKALAVREANIASRRTGEPASGTGTDCLVIAAPEQGEETGYAGKHTALGYLIGATVEEAVRLGIQRWRNP
jgi:adenosylcobinamide amidohydrolase